MALGRGGFDNQFSGINPYSSSRKPQDLSPGGSSRNSVGTGFGNNIDASKMGFFGKKDGENSDSDFFYGAGKSLLQRSSTSTDSGLPNISNLSLYGSNSSLNSGFKGKENDPSANWGSSGWGQTGSSAFQQSLTSNLTNTTTSRNSLNSNPLLQFSRSLSSHTVGSSQSSDFQQFQQQLKLLGSGQSSPRGGGLLSTQQQLSQQQQQQQQQLQQQRSGIGLPSLSMQGHSSPSHSPGPISNNSKILPNRSLPPTSTMLSTSSAALSNASNFHGFIGGQLSRNPGGGLSQNLLNSVMHPGNSDGTNVNSSGMLGPPGGVMNAFDSDFPALANRVGNSQSSRTGKNSIENSQEFQMQNEDFPALPGSNPTQGGGGGGGVVGDGINTTVHPALGQLTQTQPSPQSSAQNQTNAEGKENSTTDAYSLGSSYEQILKDGKFVADKKPRTPVSGIQTNSSGVITNIPSGMVTDQFGMIGLLSFIRAAETEPELVTLALGSDLTTLGLNLNSTESLYHTFGSPFSDTTCNPHEIDFYTPPEYLISSHVREKIAPIQPNRYGEDLLFYLYYTNSGEVLQLAAAAALYNRKWRYHKDERVWITRFPGVEPQIKMSTYERGTYYYFDPQGWRKVPKEFHVEYGRLEEDPTRPQQEQLQQ